MGRVAIEFEGSAINTFAAVSPADIVNADATDVKAADADKTYFITDVTVSNMHAAQGTRVDILNGATLVYSGPAAANGGGFDHSFETPIQCTKGNAIKAQCGTAGAAVRVAVSGYYK